MDIFDFAKDSRVIVEVSPDEPAPINFNGWDFATSSTHPYRRSFEVKLYGMRWYLGNGTLDLTQNPELNIGRLLAFYREHRLSKPFLLHHEYLGAIECKFKAKLDPKEAIPNSDGLVDVIELSLIHSNPRYE
jgi:hypothetical protein